MLEIKENGALVAVTVNEDLIIESAFDLQMQMREVLNKVSMTTLIIDLSPVMQVDNTGIGVLVAVATRTQAMGITAFLYKPSDKVLELVDKLGITGFFTILNDETELLNYI